MSVAQFGSIPPGNFMAAAKAFYQRGGFVNGLNPTITGRIWYVNTINGSDGNSGRSPGAGGAFATMAKAFTKLGNGDIVSVSGVVREQLVAPEVFDITIIGAANQPRQATSSGTPTGGGATWIAPASPTAATPLLEIKRQGWSFQNIFMSAHTDAACIKLTRTAVDIVDGSHFEAVGCVFGGGLYGIEDAGGNAFLRLIGNRFQNISGATAYAIRNTSTAAATPLQWVVIGNIFRNNKNHILAPVSQGHFENNDFGIVGNTVTAVIALSLTGGLNNTVVQNYLNRPADTSPNATLYVGGTNDLWYQNFLTDAVGYGVPDNS